MVESSDTFNTDILLVYYEGSRGSTGGYSTYDDGFTLHNYMNHAPPSYYVISYEDVLEKINKTGDVVDLGDNCFDVCGLYDATRELLEQLMS